MARSMTLRLSEDMSADLEVVARVRGTTVANSIRIAVARYLATLAADSDFQERMGTALEEEERVLERLGRLTPTAPDRTAQR
jgi:hypothetical protein